MNNEYIKLVEETLTEGKYSNANKWFTKITSKLKKKYGGEWKVELSLPGHYDLLWNNATFWSSIGGFMNSFPEVQEILYKDEKE